MDGTDGKEIGRILDPLNMNPTVIFVPLYPKIVKRDAKGGTTLLEDSDNQYQRVLASERDPEIFAMGAKVSQSDPE